MPARNNNREGFDALITGNIYHLYTRSVQESTPFKNKNFCIFLLKLMNHYKKFNTAYSEHLETVKKKGIENCTLRMTRSSLEASEQGMYDYTLYIPIRFHAYCIMPNHFHFIIEQLVDNGISYYINRLLKSFTFTYNKINKRSGSLWEDRFKAKLILNDEYYLQALRYVHLNPVESKKLGVTNLSEYPYSSYLDAIGDRKGTICDHDFLYKLRSKKEYKEFINSKISESERKLINEIAF